MNFLPAVATPPVIVLASCLLFTPLDTHSQTIADGVDNPTGTTFTTSSADRDTDEDYPEGKWTFDTATTYDGIDSIRSTLVDKKFSLLEAEVEGPALLSFRWKCSLEQYFDTFGLTSAGHSFAITGEKDWEHRSIELDCGTQKVTWYVDRNTTSATGPRSAWIDDIVVTPIPAKPELQEALDNHDLDFHSINWVNHSNPTSIDGDHAESGDIADGESASLLFEVEGPAVVEFSWALYGEYDAYSQFNLHVDNQSTLSLQGESPLSNQLVRVGPGTHCFTFSYYQDFPAYSEEPYTGTKAAALDNLRVTPISNNPVLAAAIEREGGVYSNDWEFAVGDSIAGNTAVKASAAETNTTRHMYVDLPDEAGLLTFHYKTETDPNSGYLFIYIDDEEYIRQTGQHDWQKAEFNLPERADRMLEALFFRYTDVDANSPQTSVLIDNVQFVPGATNYRPDLWLRAKRGTGYRGSNVYSTGSRQKVTRKTNDRKPYGIYPVRLQNDSPNYSDTITLRGTRSNRHFKTYFLLKSGNKYYNYSSALFSGRVQVTSMQPAEIQSFELQIARKRRSSRKARTVKLTARSKTDSSKIDVVKARLKVKRNRR
ncbi:MAG: hypothetical protein MI807_00600 [Verrucomicrobiales bacterium]|nr:hypothetical protein [Verrucomicrobiales bacterium]